MSSTATRRNERYTRKFTSTGVLYYGANKQYTWTKTSRKSQKNNVDCRNEYDYMIININIKI